MPGKIKRFHVERGAIEAHDLVAGAIKFEVAIPIVSEGQSVTSATLSTLNGYAVWKLSNFSGDYIDYIYVELEYESAGSGDVDLYNVSDSSKISDLVAPTAATAHTITRVDVTSAMKAITAQKTIGIQAAGDGTNALTVYSAKLVIVMSFS